MIVSMPSVTLNKKNSQETRAIYGKSIMLTKFEKNLAEIAIDRFSIILRLQSFDLKDYILNPPKSRIHVERTKWYKIKINKRHGHI
jgi:hypothetical protein